MTPRRARRLAALLLVLSLAAAAAFVRFRFFSTLPLIVAVAIGCAAFLLISRRIGKMGQEVPEAHAPPARRRLKFLLATLFFLLTAASLATLVGLADEKPFAYFVAAAASGAFLAAFMGLVETRREILAGIAMLGVVTFNFLGSSLLAFSSGLGGADSSLHLHFLVIPIVETGFIPPLDACGLIYGTFPAHHILVASGSLLVGSAPAPTYYALGFLVMTLPVLVTFIIGRKLFGVRAGLLAALLLAGASYYISWASHAATLTFSIPAIATILLVLHKLLERTTVRMLVLSLFPILALILTHPYSSIIFGIALLGLVVAQRIVRGGEDSSPWGTRIVGVAFAYTLLLDWSNFSCLVTKSFQLAAGYARAFEEEAVLSPPAVYDTLPLGVILGNTVGDSILFAVAIIGFFLLVSRRASSREATILGPTLALIVLAVVGLVSTLEYILPNRIYVFLQFVGLAPLAGLGLGYMSRGIAGALPTPKALTRIVLVGAIAGAFLFASSSSVIAGFETSPWAGNQPYVKLFETRFEQDASRWMCAYAPDRATVETSPSLSGLSRFEIAACVVAAGGTSVKMKVVEENRSIELPGFVPGTLIVFSKYDLDPGFQAALTGIGQFGRGVYDRFEARHVEELQVYDRFYDNGAIQVYRVGS